MSPRPLHAWLLPFCACGWAACDPIAKPEATAIATPAAALDGPFAPGHLLVELRPGVALPAAPATAVAAFQATPKPATYVLGEVELELLRQLTAPTPSSRSDDGPIYLFQLGPSLPPERLAAATRAAQQQVASDPRVRRVELDRIRRAATVPSDPHYGGQWSLPLIHAPAAWAVTHGSAQVTVAVLDTGILPEHPDLKSRLVAGYDFISNPASADDGDSHRDADPTDTGSVDSSRLHGSHVAGIIGAASNNGQGIVGIDWSCRLMPVRVLGINGGDGLDSDIADALHWASGIAVGQMVPASRPADILNLSFGGPTYSFTLQRAVSDAIDRGLLVIAAAGNGGTDATTYSPGGLDGVITVGASDRSGQRADYSNYGPRVDLLAPGGSAELTDAGQPDGILSTYRDEGLHDDPASPYSYSQLAGTSQAAPHVSGAAALARALWPGLRQSALATLLVRSADAKYRCDRDPLGGCGAGLLNVEALLQRVAQQVACGCSGDMLCLDGGSCQTPPPLHPPRFSDPTIHGGWCSVGGPAASDGQPWLLGLGVGVSTLLLRRRLRLPEYS